MPARAFLRTSQGVFASGAHLTREQAFLAAARLHVKPASLLAPLPVCVLVTDEQAEAQRLLLDARAVDVEAWLVTGAEAEAADRATTVTLTSTGADVSTGTRVRRVTFSRLAAFVDLRLKQPGGENRCLVLAPDDAAPILVTMKDLTVEGPSRQGALVRLTNDLHQAVSAASRRRMLVQAGTPQQLGVPPELPAEVLALALAEGVRRSAGRPSS